MLKPLSGVGYVHAAYQGRRERPRGPVTTLWGENVRILLFNMAHSVVLYILIDGGVPKRRETRSNLPLPSFSTGLLRSTCVLTHNPMFRLSARVRLLSK